ncbi:MAG: glycoside hydrolase family 127 protein, partial [Anaerolineae bacterium]|nr:glycoside hydrolase family 127 protein [Anaerolineae bacterium]
QHPSAGDYVRAALAGTPFHLTPKPRWESLHSIQTILSFYEITGEAHYRQAFENLWHSIAQFDRHNTGGFSSGEKATGNPYDPGAIETCCTVAWMVLCVDMLRLTGDSRVADELELSTLNAAVGAQSPSGRWWTYNTPMDGVRRASAHDIVFQAREGAPELNCCSVNGPRSLGLLSEWAIMVAPGGVAVNYYGPCVISLPLEGGSTLTITQETDYPRHGGIAITLQIDRPRRFALLVRIPAWSRRSDVTVNGKSVEEAIPGQYLHLCREWRSGDCVHLVLDTSLRVLVGEREAAGKVSLYRGPLLLAYDRRFNAMDAEDLCAPDLHSEAAMVRSIRPQPPP